MRPSKRIVRAPVDGPARSLDAGCFISSWLHQRIDGVKLRATGSKREGFSLSARGDGSLGDRRAFRQLRRMYSYLRRTGPSLVGQGLNFIAFTIPVAFGRYRELAFFVLVSTLTTVLVLPATLAFPSVYPGLRDQSDAILSVKASFGSLCVTSCLLFVAGELVPALPAELRGIALYGSVMTLAQGSFLMCLGREVRSGTYKIISWARFWNGSVTVVGTAIACSLSHSQGILVLPAVIAFAASITYMVFSHSLRCTAVALLGARGGIRAYVRYARMHSKAMLSAFLTTAAFQAGSFALLGLGRLAVPWTLVVRVGGGFATIARFVIAPFYEIEVAAGARRSDTLQASKGNSGGLRTGVGLGVTASAAVLGLLTLGGSMHGLGAGTSVGVSMSAVVLTTAALGTSLVASNLVLLGAQSEQLVWSTAKAGLTVVILLAFRRLTVLIALAALEAVSSVLYILLLKHVLERTSFGRRLPQNRAD